MAQQVLQPGDSRGEMRGGLRAVQWAIADGQFRGAFAG